MPIPEDTVVLAMRMAGVRRENARVSTVVVNGRESLHTIVDTGQDDVAVVHVFLTDHNTTELTTLGRTTLPKGL